MALSALLPLGEQAQVGGLLREAKELAIAVDDADRLARVEVQLTLFLWEEGSHRAALVSGTTALELATARGLENISLAARVQIGIVHHAVGNFRRALALHEGVLHELVAAGLEKRRLNWAAYPSVITRAFCADSCIDLGDFARADTFLREGQALTAEVGHPYSRTMIDTVIGRYHLARGEPATASRTLEEAVRKCREDEIHTTLPGLVAALGTAYARSDLAEKAIEILQTALDGQTYLRAGNYTHYLLLMAISEAYWRAGHASQALEKARHAEQLARDNGEKAHVAKAVFLLGAIQAQQDPVAADTAYRDALQRAEHHHMRPLIVDCWLGLADVERRLGRPDADVTLDTARKLSLDLNPGATH